MMLQRLKARQLQKNKAAQIPLKPNLYNSRLKRSLSGSQSESQPSAEAEEASTNNTGSAEENASVEKIESGDNESDDAQENGQSNDGESERAKLIEKPFRSC